MRQLARVGVVLPEDSDDLIIPMLENMREDRRIEEVRSRLISSLANSLAAVVYLIHPELIIMGGIYQTAPDSLLGDLQTALNAATASLPDSHVQLAKPTLASPGISAGATIALESFVYNDIGNL
jgi:predicted NBD/HSP70 family sugar kinase